MSGLGAFRSPYDVFRSTPVRRKVFVSYHHANDQWYYDEFSRFFHDQYEAIFDNSLERQIDSDDVRYVLQRIRDDFVGGTSCTVVLLGAETPNRKYVDWEIKATLDKDHGLVGIVLSSCKTDSTGKYIVPNRFHDDLSSGHAKLGYWKDLTVQNITNLINAAVAAPAANINNSRQMMQRNT